MGDGQEENIGQVSVGVCGLALCARGRRFNSNLTKMYFQLLMEDVGRFGLQEDILNMRHEEDTDDEGNGIRYSIKINQSNLRNAALQRGG